MRYLHTYALRRYLGRGFATAANNNQVLIPQTVIEKVVQKYAVGLPPGKKVKAGDYVMIRPEHVMTHDNTGPVISKFVYSLVIACQWVNMVCKIQFYRCDKNIESQTTCVYSRP